MRKINKYKLTTERNKAKIIQAAQTLFKEKGVSQVSMKEIAKYSGISQASIYNYYGSKEAVVVECAKIVMKDTFSKAIEILDMNISYLDKLNKALSLCTEGLSKEISQHFSKKALEDKTLVRLLVENMQEVKNEVYIQYIELGKEENYIDKNIPTEIYLSFINAISTMGSDITINNNLEENTKYIHKLLLYGILGK
jgi:AcrR family transcriptional regulator